MSAKSATKSVYAPSLSAAATISDWSPLFWSSDIESSRSELVKPVTAPDGSTLDPHLPGGYVGSTLGRDFWTASSIPATPRIDQVARRITGGPNGREGIDDGPLQARSGRPDVHDAREASGDRGRLLDRGRRRPQGLQGQRQGRSDAGDLHPGGRGGPGGVEDPGEEAERPRQDDHRARRHPRHRAQTPDRHP